MNGIKYLKVSSWVKEIEIQYNPLKKYPKPKNQPIRKKYLVVSLNFFPIFKIYNRAGKDKKFIIIKL